MIFYQLPNKMSQQKISLCLLRFSAFVPIIEMTPFILPRFSQKNFFYSDNKKPEIPELRIFSGYYFWAMKKNYCFLHQIFVFDPLICIPELKLFFVWYPVDIHCPFQSGQWFEP